MRKWWPLVAVCLGSFMLITDTTVVTVALPDMAEDLGASLSGLQWVMNIYTLVLAALTLSTGSFGDLFGRRRVYVIALALFGGASLVCALAPDPGLLIAARGVQGIGGSAMFVTGMAIVGGSYEGRARAGAIGVWSAVGGAAGATGPLLGGLLTQSLGWQAIFAVNVPLAAVTLVLTLRYVKESKQPERATVDLPGMLAFGIGSGALTFALIKAGDDGWTASTTLGLLALAALALIAFVAAELRAPHPMLDLALFRDASFLAVMFGTIATAWGFACLIYASLWLQSVAGLSPLKTGLAMIPLAATTFVTSMVSGKRLHRVSPRLAIATAFALIGIGCALNGLLVDGDSGWAALLPGLVLTGAGVGVGMPATGSAVLASVPVERVGMASGTMATFRQLGQALGVAVLGLLFTHTLRSSLTGRVADADAAVNALSSGRKTSVRVLQDAGADGLSAVYLVSAALALSAAVLAVALVRRPAPAPAPTPEREPAEAR